MSNKQQKKRLISKLRTRNKNEETGEIDKKKGGVIAAKRGRNVGMLGLHLLRRRV